MDNNHDPVLLFCIVTAFLGYFNYIFMFKPFYYNISRFMTFTTL